MGVNMTLPAAFEDTLSTQEQIQWLYKYKEALLTAGANIQITRQGDTVVISAIGEGFSPAVEVTEITGGHRVTITDGTGEHTFDVMDGVDGEDGVSPAVVVTSITGGHRVVITDEDHPSGQSFDVMDGVDGTDGTSITVKSVTPVSGGVNLVITDSAGDHTIFLANGPQGLTGPQGPQGPTGATGATGETGATPIITMTASADGTYSATPTVTVVKGGTDLNPTFSLAFSGLRGQTGPQGPQGETGEQGPAGEDGADGTDGVTPEITATATADATSSDNPTVTVTKTGTDAAPSFAFAFSGLKGATGATGETGPQGPAGQDGTDGTDGVTPVITATATADATHSTNPSVTVTKSGTDAAPSFAFAFSGLQGEQGPQGETGATGAQGPQGETGATGATGATGPQGPAGPGVPAGGTAGQVLAKASGTDYDTEWVTPSGGSEVTCGVIDATNISSIVFSDASGTAITIDSSQVNKPAILVTKKSDGTNTRFEIEVAQDVYCGAATSDSGMALKTLEFVFGNGTNALTVSIDGETVTLPEESYSSSLHLVNGKSGGIKCKLYHMLPDTTEYPTGIYSVWYEGKQIHLKYTLDEAATVARPDYLSIKADKELKISAGGGGGGTNKSKLMKNVPNRGIYDYAVDRYCEVFNAGFTFQAGTSYYGDENFKISVFKEKWKNSAGEDTDSPLMFEGTCGNSGTQLPSFYITLTNALSIGNGQAFNLKLGGGSYSGVACWWDGTQLVNLTAGQVIGPYRPCRIVSGSNSIEGYYCLYTHNYDSKVQAFLSIFPKGGMTHAANTQLTVYLM